MLKAIFKGAATTVMAHSGPKSLAGELESAAHEQYEAEPGHADNRAADRADATAENQGIMSTERRWEQEPQKPGQRLRKRSVNRVALSS
jgi:hypothetical protein